MDIIWYLHIVYMIFKVINSLSIFPYKIITDCPSLQPSLVGILQIISIINNYKKKKLINFNNYVNEGFAFSNSIISLKGEIK